MGLTPTDIRWFASPAELRQWLELHHAEAAELWVGAHRKDTGRPTVTWEEIVDEALCFGWIDGIRKRAGEDAWTIRLTPRRKGSIWSAVNIANVERLTAEGRMTPAGVAAFAARDDAKSRVYSYERAAASLEPDMETRFREDADAWAFWEAQPPGYRKLAAWYILSARQEATRERRLQRLIADSAAGRRIGALQSPTPRLKA